MSNIDWTQRCLVSVADTQYKLHVVRSNKQVSYLILGALGDAYERDIRCTHVGSNVRYICANTIVLGVPSFNLRMSVCIERTDQVNLKCVDVL